MSAFDHAACDAALAAAEERTEFWKQRAERTLVELKRVNDAAEEKVAALEERDQRWVDQVCHYRNLAIMLGAKPEQMLSGHDRDLAAKWGEPSTHDTDWTMDDEPAEVAENWELLATTESKLSIAVAALERIKTYPFRQYDLSVTQGDIAREALQRIKEV